MSSARILIVEDERIIAMSLQHMLLDLGYTVVGSTDRGEDAVQQSDTLQPDLVLMDIHLAGAMDGIDAARQIHERLHRPVVFLTAFAEDETLSRAQRSAPFGYLVKPVETRELHVTIQTALTRAAAERAAAQRESELRLSLDAASVSILSWTPRNAELTLAGRLAHDVSQAALGPNGMAAFLAHVYPDDRGEVSERLQQALNVAHPLPIEFRWFGAGSKLRWIDGTLVTMHSDAGPRVVGLLRDVDAQAADRRPRQALVAFDALGEAILVLDAERRIVSVNAAFTKMTGYAANEVLGREPDEWLLARSGEPEQASLAPEARWRGAVDCRRKSGEVFSGWVKANFVRDEEGEITHHVLVISDISRMRGGEAALDHLAHHDALTGLPNRLLLDERLELSLAQAARDGQRGAVLFIDLDGFKEINDRFHHGGGDKVLRSVAGRLASLFRRSDTVARFGGDEFVVVLTDITHPAECELPARKVLAALGAPIQMNGHNVRVTASIGIAVYPDHGNDRAVLLLAADAAMYRAKAQGGNQFCFHAPERATEH